MTAESDEAKITAEISNSSKAQELEGCLVKVNPAGQGKCSVTTLSGSASGKFDVTKRKIGSLPLTDNVKIYDQVGSTPVVEVDLEDILVDTVAQSDITYVGTDAEGKVNVILLNDVTGMGFYRLKMVSSGERGTSEYYEYRTAAIENSDGLSAYCATLLSLRYGAVGGLAVTAGGKIAGSQNLTKVTDVSRRDFEGDDYVVLEGVRVPIADQVQVYNEDNDSWIDLDTARGYSDTLSIYYSGTLGGDAKVRLIVVGG